MSLAWINQISTPSEWAQAQLAYMGLPTTSSNVDFLLGWYTREGGNWLNTASYNPLNTTLSLPGSTSMNSVGVQAYASWSQGLSATALTLTGYPNVLAALASGNASAIDEGGGLASDLLRWSGGGYSSVSPTSSAPGSGAPYVLTGAAPSASNPANGGGASNAAALLNPYDTARLGLVTSIATYGPGMLDQSSTTGYVTEGWTSWLKYLSPALWIGGQASKDAQKAVNGAVTAGEDVVKGAEIIAGIFAWLTKPVNLLRIAEIIAGAMCLAVGIAMYARILAPGVGGLVASVAEGATPLGRAAAVGTKTARSVAKKIPDANDRRAVRAMKSPGPTRKSAEYKAAAKGRKFNALGEEYF